MNLKTKLQFTLLSVMLCIILFFVYRFILSALFISGSYILITEIFIVVLGAILLLMSVKGGENLNSNLFYHFLGTANTGIAVLIAIVPIFDEWGSVLFPILFPILLLNGLIGIRIFMDIYSNKPQE